MTLQNEAVFKRENLGWWFWNWLSSRRAGQFPTLPKETRNRWHTWLRLLAGIPSPYTKKLLLGPFVFQLPRKKEVFPIAWKQLLQSSYKPLSPAARITSIPSLDSCWFPETGASKKRPPRDTITCKRVSLVNLAWTACMMLSRQHSKTIV